jgi:septal ring factor EnvC (AmiA/AmiB activator)
MLFKTLLMLLLVLLVSAGGVLAQKNSRDKLQKQKSGLEKDIANTSKLIEETRKNSKQTTQQIQLIESQIRNYEELEEKTSLELQLLDRDILNKKLKSEQLSKEIDQMKALYARMIYFAYLTRRPSNRLMYLFSSKSFMQAWRRMRYFSEYSAIRKRQLQKIVSTRAEIAKVVEGLEKMRAEKADLIAEQVSNKKALDLQKSEKDKVVKDLKKQEKKLKQDLSKKQKEAADIQRQIKKLIEQEIEASKKKTNVVAVKQNTGNNTTNNKPVADVYRMSPEEARISTTFEGNKGKLSWPVSQGTITSRYGEHPHPVLAGVKVKNNGVDITCPKGTSARAVFDGTISAVITAPNGTRLVMIRHGEYLSVYSNIESTSLKSGASVKALQNIGPVAADENGMYVIHFEIWKEKELQNPEYWLAK